MASRSYTGPDGLNPRMLRLKWSGDGGPQQWDEKIILTGSEDSNFLLLTQPTAPIGASAGTILSVFLCNKCSHFLNCIQVSTICVQECDFN